MSPSSQPRRAPRLAADPIDFETKLTRDAVAAFTRAAPPKTAREMKPRRGAAATRPPVDTPEPADLPDPSDAGAVARTILDGRRRAAEGARAARKGGFFGLLGGKKRSETVSEPPAAPTAYDLRRAPASSDPSALHAPPAPPPEFHSELFERVQATQDGAEDPSRDAQAALPAVDALPSEPASPPLHAERTDPLGELPLAEHLPAPAAAPEPVPAEPAAAKTSRDAPSTAAVPPDERISPDVERLRPSPNGAASAPLPDDDSPPDLGDALVPEPALLGVQPEEAGALAGIAAFYRPLDDSERAEAAHAATGSTSATEEAPLPVGPITWAAPMGIPEAPSQYDARLEILAMAIDFDKHGVVRDAAENDPHLVVRNTARKALDDLAAEEAG